MKFAVAKQTMTPDKPVFLAGFGARTHKSEGVLDGLYVKTVLLSANRNLLIVAFDALGADRGFVQGIKEALRERFGFAEAEVLLQFSHTHASLHLTGEKPEWRRGNYSLGQDDWPTDSSMIDYTEDVAYYRDLREKIVEMTEQCFAELRPGRLELATGRSAAAVSRRLMTSSGLQFAPAPEAEIDDSLSVLTLTDDGGRLEAVLFSVGCHPTSMGPDNYRLSSEFVGHACRRLEEAYPQATAVFLQGCAADLKPRHSADEARFKSCTSEEMQAAGDELAGEVADVLRQGTFAVLDGPFRAELSDLELSVGETDEPMMQSLLAGEKGEFYRRAALRTVEAERRGVVRTKLPLYVQVWELSPGAAIVALESEIPTGYALRLRRDHPERSLVVLGYSNGVYSYIPTRRILEEGGYEADHPFTIGFKSRFAWETEERIVGEIRRLLEA